VGERWTLLVIRDLLPGPRRFQDLQASLPGIAPNILSERIKRMEAHGLVEHRLYSDHPPRAEYALTDKRRELGLVVGALAQWGSHHVYPQHALVHEDCGHAVKLVYYCPECGRRVQGAGVKLARAARRRARQPSRSSATVTKS
jgi:DNA-binding HxlR family transcriptional regulator